MPRDLRLFYYKKLAEIKAKEERISNESGKKGVAKPPISKPPKKR